MRDVCAGLDGTDFEGGAVTYYVRFEDSRFRYFFYRQRQYGKFRISISAPFNSFSFEINSTITKGALKVIRQIKKEINDRLEEYEAAKKRKQENVTRDAIMKSFREEMKSIIEPSYSTQEQDWFGFGEIRGDIKYWTSSTKFTLDIPNEQAKVFAYALLTIFKSINKQEENHVG